MINGGRGGVPVCSRCLLAPSAAYSQQVHHPLLSLAGLVCPLSSLDDILVQPLYLIARRHHLPALVSCLRHPPLLTLTATRGSSRHWQCVALTASASTSMSPLPGPPVVVAMPPGVLSLCRVVRTLTAQLMAWPCILCLLGEG